MVEEPFDSEKQGEDATEYPIQNFRNRAKRQEQSLQPNLKVQSQTKNVMDPVVSKAEASPSEPTIKQSPNLIHQPMGPFFNQPFKPVQVKVCFLHFLQCKAKHIRCNNGAMEWRFWANQLSRRLLQSVKQISSWLKPLSGSTFSQPTLPANSVR